MVVTVIATGFGTDSNGAAPAAVKPAAAAAPAAEEPIINIPKVEDTSLDDDVIDIFNMFKNK